MSNPAPTSPENKNSIHDEIINQENEEPDLDNIDKLSEIKPQNETSFQKESSPKENLEEDQSPNKSSDFNKIEEACEVLNEDPQIEEVKEKQEPIKIKSESELIHPIYQLKLKMDEKNTNTQELVNSYIFNEIEDHQTINTEDISENLKNFMEYSKPEEVDDLVLYLTNGMKAISKDELSESINTKIGFKKLNDKEGKIYAFLYYRSAKY